MATSTSTVVLGAIHSIFYSCDEDDQIFELEPISVVGQAMNEVLQQGIPEIWRKSRMVPINKGKGDVLECNNYRGIKLIRHPMKLWERLIKAMLRHIT